MEEYAVRFFVLLNHAYKIEAQEVKHLAVASMLPWISDSKRREIISSLDLMTSDILDIGLDDDDYSGLEKLKGKL